LLELVRAASVVHRLYQIFRKIFIAHMIWRYTPQILMGIALVVSTTFMFPQRQSSQFANLKERDVYVGEEIVAPFTYMINKSEEEYNNDKKTAQEKVPLVFVRVDSIERNSLMTFDEFVQRLDMIRDSILPDSIRIRQVHDLFKTYYIFEENIPYLLKLDDTTPKNKITNGRWTTQARPNAPGQPAVSYEMLKRDARRIVVDMYSIGILNLERRDIPDDVKKISVIGGGQEIVDDLENYCRGIDDAKRLVLEDKLRPVYPQDGYAVKLGYNIVTAFLDPNLIYDAAETGRRIKKAVDSVPLAKGTVLAKERIVNNHERITKEILEKLQSLAQARAEMEARQGGIKPILPYFGRAFFVALAVSFTVLFLFVSRRSNFNSVKQVFMIFVIMLLLVSFTFLINQIGYSKYKYLIPISIASMLLTIFFDSRLAFVVTVTLSLIIGAMRGNEFGIMVISLFVGTISVFIVRQIQARAWILKGIIFISGAYVFSISAIEFLRNPDYLNGKDFVCGIANGALSPILTYGLMVIFEYVFQMTTDSTLLELSDLNRPLLRQLAIRAPGTYHHSIMVGNLAESAAEAIGANALRARVGSYHHDIGKMEMPEYFVENQRGGKNPHEKLAPNMSCLILINHVKRGLEIAEEYNLPREIRDFIPQHHGTNLISYFYNKAIETQDGTEINEADFRYPGPRPQTKEAGIVMLADAVEASSRTLKDPTVSRIRSLVNSFIQERLNDGELNECPLTIRDLNLIRESFVSHLTGIFHSRIEYPGRRKKLLSTNSKKSAEKAIEAPR